MNHTNRVFGQSGKKLRILCEAPLRNEIVTILIPLHQHICPLPISRSRSKAEIFFNVNYIAGTQNLVVIVNVLTGTSFMSEVDINEKLGLVNIGVSKPEDDQHFFKVCVRRPSSVVVTNPLNGKKCTLRLTPGEVSELISMGALIC